MNRRTGWKRLVLVVVIGIGMVSFLPVLPFHARASSDIHAAMPVPQATGTPVPANTAMSCTFTVKFPVVNLRTGPGTGYDWSGFALSGQILKVTGESTGNDGFVWWQAANAWVRSDLGTSDCNAICGNDVCEYGESSSSCAKDCQDPTSSSNSSSAGTGSKSSGCDVPDCESCYKTIWCYPNCNECTCSKNEFGCSTCYCTYPKK